MKKKLVESDSTMRLNGYAFSDVKVQLPKNDTDIVVSLPNGDCITLQFRIEGSLDILLPENMAVHNWQGTNMKPARGRRGQASTRYADQLMIPLTEKQIQ